MPIRFTPLFNQVLEYPTLEITTQILTSPVVAIKTGRLLYREGFTPDVANDKLIISQLVTVNGEEVLTDQVQLQIIRERQLIPLSVNTPYKLRVQIPAWYQAFAVEVLEAEEVPFFPPNEGVTGLLTAADLASALTLYYTRSEVDALLVGLPSEGGISQAELELALSTKANQEDLIEGISLLNSAIALKADAAALGDFVTAEELISGLMLKADANHSHPTLYYSKTEVDALINGVGTSSPPQFDFAYLNDPNGLFYWIGSNELTQAFTNPHTSGAIVVSSSGGMGSGSHANLVDRWVGENTFVNPAPQPWVQVDLLTRNFRPSGYTIRQRGYDQNAIKHWQFQGSTDGQNFTVLDEFRYQLIAAETIYRKVQIPNAYRYFRVQMMSQSSGNDWYFCINEIELYGSLV